MSSHARPEEALRQLSAQAPRSPSERFAEVSSRETAVWLLFAVALCVRLLVIAQTVGFDTPASLEAASDSRIHIALVQSLLGGHGFSIRGTPTAITPPLYIYFLAGLYWLGGDPSVVRIVQAILGGLGCVVLYAIGRRMFDAATGLVAGLLLAVYPLAVYLTALHLTENLFLVLLLLVLWQALRVVERATLPAAMVLGGLIGLAALTRAVFIAFLPFLLVWAVTVWGVRNAATYRTIGTAALAAMIVVLPWTVRNYVALHAVVPIQSNAGLVFWAGNNPYADGGLVWPTARTWTAGPPPDDGMYGWRGLTPAEDNQRYLDAAASWIRGHPRAYLRLLGHKLVRLYGFTRTADRRDVHVAIAPAAFQTLVMLLGLAGLWLTARRWRQAALLLTLIVFTNLMAVLSAGGTRYTVPMVPSVVLLAAVAVVRAIRVALGVLAPGHLGVPEA